MYVVCLRVLFLYTPHYLMYLDRSPSIPDCLKLHNIENNPFLSQVLEEMEVEINNWRTDHRVADYYNCSYCCDLEQ
jgi:hypothetical protein